MTDRLAVVELIAATSTKISLKVESALDTRICEKGIKVSDAEMKPPTSTATRSILSGITLSTRDHQKIGAVNVVGFLSRRIGYQPR